MNALRRIGGVLSTALVVVVVVLAVALLGGRLLGFEAFTVLSGSMEPTYHTGSVIWVNKCDASEVEVGDPITFVMNEDLDVATHRVIEIDTENSHFYTQGDANDSPDGSPVHFNNLIGVPVFTVPYLGYLVSYIQAPPGSYIAIIVAVALLVLMFIPSLFDRLDKSNPEKDLSKNNALPKGGVYVPRGSVAQQLTSTQHTDTQAYPGYSQPLPPTYQSFTPEQRAAYAKRELERRRAMRAAANFSGIPGDSHRNVPTRKIEEREMK